MHAWMHRVEKYVDALIGPSLILLLFLIVGELFLGKKLEHYSVYVDVFDLFMISVLAIDLGFKFHRVRKIPKFLKMYWLQIIALIPFFLVFRFTEILGLQEILERSQSAFSGVQEVQKLEKEAVTIVMEAGRASRTAKLIRMFRFASRIPRFLGAVPFFEKPTGGHHWHEKRGKRAGKRKAAAQKI